MEEKYRNRLRTMRKTRRLLQDEVASAVGIAKHTLMGYERWKRAIPSDKLIALAKFYGCSTDYILYLKEE